MERLEEIEQYFNKTDFATTGIDFVHKAIVLITKELIEQRKQITELKLLIEHEEKVRTTKASKQTGGKRVSEKFKHGDRVIKIGENRPGTIIAISGKRIAVRYGRRAGIWYDSKDFTHSVA